MATVDNADWIMTDNSDLTVYIYYENQTLGTIDLGGGQADSPATIVLQGSGDSSATFKVTPNGEEDFLITLFCQHTAAQAGVAMSVLQNGAVLRCTDLDNAVLNNAPPGPYGALHIDDLAQGAADTVKFRVPKLG